VRLVIARCQVDYSGRLTAHLSMATRLLIVKADGSVLIHSDGGSYKPLNWMSPPCTFQESALADGAFEWLVEARNGDALRIRIDELVTDTSYHLGPDPGLQKDGVERHLQELLADHPGHLATELALVRREYPTAIGPVDLMCRETTVVVEFEPPAVRHVAVEIKRRATLDAVEQLSRYLELLNRDPLLVPVRGILAAQAITPQARTLAEDRGIECVVIDYSDLVGLPDDVYRLF
jgi:hypothetical protein